MEQFPKSLKNEFALRLQVMRLYSIKFLTRDEVEDLFDLLTDEDNHRSVFNEIQYITAVAAAIYNNRKNDEEC